MPHNIARTSNIFTPGVFQKTGAVYSTSISSLQRHNLLLSTKRGFSNKRVDVVPGPSLYDESLVTNKKPFHKRLMEDDSDAVIQSFSISSLTDEWAEEAERGSVMRRRQVAEEKEQLSDRRRKKMERHNNMVHQLREDRDGDLEAFGFSKEYRSIAKKQNTKLHHEMKALNTTVFKTLRDMDRSRFATEQDYEKSSSMNIHTTYGNEDDDAGIPIEDADIGFSASGSKKPHNSTTTATKKEFKSLEEMNVNERLAAFTRSIRKITNRKEIIHTIGCFLGTFDILPNFNEELQKTAKSILRIRDRVEHKNSLEMNALVIDKFDPYTQLSELLNINKAKGTYRNIVKKAHETNTKYNGVYGTKHDIDDITLGLHKTNTIPLIPDQIIYHMLIKALLQEASFAFPSDYHNIPDLPTPAEPVPPQTHATVGEDKNVTPSDAILKKEDQMIKKAKYMSGLKDYLRLTPQTKPAISIGYQPHLHPAVVMSLKTLDYMYFVSQNPDNLVSYLHERLRKQKYDSILDMQEEDSVLQQYIADRIAKITHQIQKTTIDSARKHRLKMELLELEHMKSLELDTFMKNPDSDDARHRLQLVTRAKTKADLKARFPRMFQDPNEEKDHDPRAYVREDLLAKYGFDQKLDPNEQAEAGLDTESTMLDKLDMELADQLQATIAMNNCKPNIVSVLPIAELAHNTGDMVLAQAVLVRCYQWNILYDTYSEMNAYLEEAENNTELSEDEINALLEKSDKLLTNLNKLKMFLLQGLSNKKPLSIVQISLFDAFWSQACRVPMESSATIQASRLAQRQEIIAKMNLTEDQLAQEVLYGLKSVTEWPSWIWPSHENVEELHKLSAFENIDLDTSTSPPTPLIVPGRPPYPIATADTLEVPQILTGLKSVTYAQAFENAMVTEAALQDNLKILKRAREALWLQEEEMQQELVDVGMLPDSSLSEEQQVQKRTRQMEIIEASCQRRYQHVDRLLQCAEGWISVMHMRTLNQSIQLKQAFTSQILCTMANILDPEQKAIQTDQYYIEPIDVETDLITKECFEELILLSKALSYHSYGISTAHLPKSMPAFKKLTSVLVPRIDTLLQKLSKWGIITMRPFMLQDNTPKSSISVPVSKYQEIDDMCASVARNKLIAPIPKKGNTSNTGTSPPVTDQKVCVDIGSGDCEHAIMYAQNHPNDLVYACDILHHRLAAMLHTTRITSIPIINGYYTNTLPSLDSLPFDQIVQEFVQRCTSLEISPFDALVNLLEYVKQGGNGMKYYMTNDTNILPLINTQEYESLLQIIQDLLPNVHSSYLLDSIDTNISNVHAYTGGVLELLGALPPESVDLVHIMHPPPPTIDSYGKLPRPQIGTDQVKFEDLACTMGSKNTLLTEPMLYMCARAMKPNTHVYILSDDDRVGQWLNIVCPFDDYPFSPNNNLGKPHKKNKNKNKNKTNSVYDSTNADITQDDGMSGSSNSIMDGTEDALFVPSRAQVSAATPLLSDYFQVQELDMSSMKKQGLDVIQSRYQRMAASGQLKGKYTMPGRSRAYRLIRTSKTWE